MNNRKNVVIAIVFLVSTTSSYHSMAASLTTCPESDYTTSLPHPNTLLETISHHQPIHPLSATTTFLYCASKDASEWDWARWSNDDYIQLQGYWGGVQYKGKWVGYFAIDDSQWPLIQECDHFGPSGAHWDPHPADNEHSWWYLLKNTTTEQVVGNCYTQFNSNPYPNA